jgi:hypothetical protein
LGNPTKVTSSGEEIYVDPPVVTDLASVKYLTQIGVSVFAFFKSTKGTGEVRQVVFVTPDVSVEE